MRHSVFHRGLVGLMLAMYVFAGVACRSSDPGINVTVQNRTPGEVTDVVIKFTGGRGSTLKLLPGESFSFRAQPQRESDLAIEFKDHTGKQHSKRVEIYFERRYRGSVAITINPDGELTWVKDVTL